MGLSPAGRHVGQYPEPLFIVNRSGNRLNRENVAFYLDLAVKRCRDAGFQSVLLQDDTDFALTENVDRWDKDNVDFDFSIAATPNWMQIAGKVERSGL